MFTPAGVSDARNGFPVYLSLREAHWSPNPILLLSLSAPGHSRPINGRHVRSVRHEPSEQWLPLSE